MMLREQWFPTPIWRYMLDLSAEDFKQMQDYCLKLEKETPGRIISNKGGWQSNDIQREKIFETPLHLAFRQIIPLLQDCMSALGSPLNLTLTNSWVNINRNTNWNSIHGHELSILSGVFYLTENNSNLIFHKDPDINTYFLDNIASNRNTELSYREINYTPVKGQLIIFPSWLRHSVQPSNNDDVRISVAFNTNI